MSARLACAQRDRWRGEVREHWARRSKVRQPLPTFIIAYRVGRQGTALGGSPSGWLGVCCASAGEKATALAANSEVELTTGLRLMQDGIDTDDVAQAILAGQGDLLADCQSQQGDPQGDMMHSGAVAG